MKISVVEADDLHWSGTNYPISTIVAIISEINRIKSKVQFALSEVCIRCDGLGTTALSTTLCDIICNLPRAIIYWIWHGLGWLYAYMLENNAKRPLLGPGIFGLITVVGLQDMHSKIVVFSMVIIEYFDLFCQRHLNSFLESQSKFFWVKPKEENYRVLIEWFTCNCTIFNFS